MTHLQARLAAAERRERLGQLCKRMCQVLDAGDDQDVALVQCCQARFPCHSGIPAGNFSIDEGLFAACFLEVAELSSHVWIVDGYAGVANGYRHVGCGRQR